MRTMTRLGLLFLLVLSAGCAAGSGTTGGGDEGSQTDRYVLTSQELAQYSTDSAREAVQRLRRFWISSGARVLEKGKRIAEPLEYLDRWRADQILEMRFYDLTSARATLGPEFSTPIIEYTLRR